MFQLCSKQFLLASLALLTVLHGIKSQQAQISDRLGEAESAYQAGDYGKAEEIYGDLIGMGMKTSGVHYNLGNACYQQGAIPCAVLHYEKALKLDPGDRDAAFNLALARERIVDRIPPVEQFFLKRWAISVRDTLSITTWAVLSLGFLWLAVFLTGYRLWYGKPIIKASQIVSVLALCLFLLAFVFSLAGRRQLHDRSRAVVMERSSLHIAPSDQSEIKMEIPAGESVIILDSIYHLYKVELVNTEQGWVVKDYIARI